MNESSPAPPSFRFDHGGISVPDLEAAIAWYADVLGFQVARRFALPHAQAQAAMLFRDDLRIELFQPEQPIPLPPGRHEPDADLQWLGTKHIAFATDDIDAFDNWLQAKGADIASRVSGSFGRALFVRDVAGNLIELVSRQAATGVR